MSIDLKVIFDALECAEGYVNAAAFREVANPPHKQGRACTNSIKVRDALAMLQKHIRTLEVAKVRCVPGDYQPKDAI
jgi:hypothetical protein